LITTAHLQITVVRVENTIAACIVNIEVNNLVVLSKIQILELFMRR
jgi:hypothetical protein